MPKPGDMSRERLESMLLAAARNWLAHDGLWFQAVERAHGLDHAIEMDAEAWRRFSPIEARRIAALIELPPSPGLEGLEQALDWRLYALLNRQSTTLERGVLRLVMQECRVQAARRRKGLADFPCKSVGLVEFATFATAIDPRIRTRCVGCPPDDCPEGVACSWAFTIADSGP